MLIFRRPRFYDALKRETGNIVQENPSILENQGRLRRRIERLSRGLSRDPHFYVVLKQALQKQTQEMYALLREFGEEWGLEAFMPWWRRRMYIFAQQRVSYVKKEIPLPKPTALAGVPTTPAKRALVQPKTGPVPKGSSGGKSAGVAALLNAAAALFFRIVPPPPRPMNGALYSRVRRKAWEEQENYG